MNNDQYIAPYKLTKQFNITSVTLARWADEGKVRVLRPNGGRRIYHVGDIKILFGIAEQTLGKETVCYARVSSRHQKEDLDRQVQYLEKEYPNTKIFKDIGSGLNYNRPGFKALLDKVYSGTVETVVVSYKDRLCRFGSELVEWIFKKANVKLVVLSKGDAIEIDRSKELADDLLSITTVFVARNNGLRCQKYKRDRANQVLQSTNLSNIDPKINSENVVRSPALDIQ